MNILVTQKHLTNSLIEKEEYVQLISELCYRMPYGVKVQNINGCVEELSPMGLQQAMSASVAVTKPYLFPLSSITEEQYEEFLLPYDIEWSKKYQPYGILLSSAPARLLALSRSEVSAYCLNHTRVASHPRA